MKGTFTRLLVATILLSSAWIEASAKAREERWIASSTTAISITGDIVLSPTRLQMAGHEFPLRVAADLPDFEGDLGRVPARVLAITRPMNPRLLNGNRFGCRQAIHWIVVWQSEGGKSLGMDTFSGAQMPGGAHDAGFCGSYFYQRP